MDITNNEFTYTVDSDTPELILTITDPTGVPVENIPDLEYVTIGDVSGFDITTASDVITIADNYEITSTGTETQTWNVTVTFINLDSDQVGNAGKNFNANIIIKDKEIDLPELCNTMSLANCLVDRVYTTDGAEGLYYHDGTGSYTNASEEAGDNSYRYAGANPNNYVCFGSDEATCPAANLYRIIGVFDDQVKLIKNTSYGNYYRNELASNDWESSTLNTQVLNGTYLNNLSSIWQEKIYSASWQIGGNVSESIQQTSAKESFVNEVVSPAEDRLISTKIGLPYISDYYYAADANYWNYPGYSNLGSDYDYRSAITHNWMYSGETEWSITRNSVTVDGAFTITNNGYISNYGIVQGTQNAVRPTFYLNTDVKLASGTGTQDDPFRIEA